LIILDVVNKGYLDNLELTEVFALPACLIAFFVAAYLIQIKNIKKKPYYSFYVKGMMLKLLGGAAFCFVYVYYYAGGDTISYFESARSYSNMFSLRVDDFVSVYFHPNTRETYFMFDNLTGMPHSYMYYDYRTAFVIKLVTPIVIIGFNSYLVSTLIMSMLSFIGIWKMYELLCRYYPYLYRQFAVGFIFLPTAIFWGSGILKDTITFSGICWFVVAIERALISKKKQIPNLLIAFLSGYVVLIIKPYIIMAAIPGLIVWVFHARVLKIQSRFFRAASIPLIFLLSFAFGAGIMSLLGDKLDKFSLNKVLETATVTQQDMKRTEYLGHSFDIGKFDASIGGVLSKFPQATLAGLYRPFIWESQNVVMLLSGLENLMLLLLTVYPIYKLGLRKIFSILFREPMLLFLFSYSIFFAFSIGISTSNFGALIRFKIAFAPFFCCLLMYLFYYTENVKKRLIKTSPKDRK
jgi:hypothetical protein